MASNIKKFGGGGSYIVGNSAIAYYAAAGEIYYFTQIITQISSVYD
jgi:hypothetical protein